MNFDDSPAEARFRAEARAWLSDHAEERTTPAGFAAFEDRDGADDRDWVSACRAWQCTKFKGGYGAISWPEDWGGRGGTRMEEIIFLQEEARFEVATGASGITLAMVGPTILSHGTPEQKTHLPAMLAGDEIWCQLFSEPSAGSDLAGVRTRAVPDGDGWRITGQKVWTSGAHYADWGYIICRSDPQLPKHRGLTAFVFPMNSPGVTVRPLRQMTGGCNFNEVFFDELWVPDANRLGGRGEGWRVVITTLMNERFSVANVDPGLEVVDRLVQLARSGGFADDPVVRQRLADLYIRVQLNRYSTYRALTAIAKGDAPGPEGSIGKLVLGGILTTISDIGVALAGASGTLEGEWSSLLLASPGMRLGGGTDEVMRNILGERVLGLPAEASVDRDRPFEELPA